MRKFNLTTQAFISSIISIVLCLVMLMGTTFAWYTDGVSVDVDKIQAGKFKEVTTTNPATEKEPTTEQESTTAETTTAQSVTESTTTTTTTEPTTAVETTTQASTESTTAAESTTQSTSVETTTTAVTTTTESTTTVETTTQPTTEEASTEPSTDTSEPSTETEENEFPIIVEGEEHKEDSKVICSGKEVKAESVVIVRKAIDSIELTDITADVENGIVIEDKLEVQVITLTNCDFELASGGKLIRTKGNPKVKVVLDNVTVNGEEITSDNYHQYFNGINDVEII